MPARLEGQVILNTRPAHQQAALSAMLERDGARVVSFPAIDIVSVDVNPLQRPIAEYDALLFVSRNAVDGAFGFIQADQLSPQVQLGVIGSATRAALLERIGDRSDLLIASEPFNSEALLATPALQQVEGKTILILRGQPGRNLLGDELARRGAQVDYAELYRRELPRCGLSALGLLLAETPPTLVILTSNEGMHNLLELADASAVRRLRQIPWLLISERMRESALKLGHNAAIIVAQSASDEGIRQTICDWAGQL